MVTVTNISPEQPDGRQYDYEVGDTAKRVVLTCVVTIPEHEPGCGVYTQQVAMPGNNPAQAEKLQEYADDMAAQHVLLGTPCITEEMLKDEVVIGPENEIDPPDEPE